MVYSVHDFELFPNERHCRATTAVILQSVFATARADHSAPPHQGSDIAPIQVYEQACSQYVQQQRVDKAS